MSTSSAFREKVRPYYDQGRLIDLKGMPVDGLTLYGVCFLHENGCVTVAPASLCSRKIGTEKKHIDFRNAMAEGRIPVCQTHVAEFRLDLKSVAGLPEGSFDTKAYDDPLEGFEDIPPAPVVAPLKQAPTSVKPEIVTAASMKFADILGEDVMTKYGVIDKNIAQYAKKHIPESKNVWERLCLKEFGIFDTETSGIGNNAEVLELAAVKVKDFKIVAAFRELIIPTRRIEPEAQKVHGLSAEFLKKNGRPAKAVYEDFVKFVGDLPFGGHNNIRFDNPKVENHAREAGVPIKIKTAFDTLEISKLFMTMPNHKLADIIDRLRLRDGLKSHSALDDVVATLRYAVILRQLYCQAHNPTTILF